MILKQARPDISQYYSDSLLRYTATLLISLLLFTTGKASDEAIWPKPLFLAATYFLGKLLILPFVSWQPSQWPLHVYGKITLMVVFGAVGGMLEYGAVLYLPVSVVAMVRVAGLVFFTGFASSWLTQRSPMTWYRREGEERNTHTQGGGREREETDRQTGGAEGGRERERKVRERRRGAHL